MRLRPLPSEVEELLVELNAPARLEAHLSLVHDVACQLTTRLNAAWPDLSIDERAIKLGAAIHDIGKTVHPEELSQPGHDHEAAGRALLEKRGWPVTVSRFAVTHAQQLDSSCPIEDLIVAVADKVWKGKREDALEHALVQHITGATRQEPWQVWLTLDDLLTCLCEAAEERLHWQGSH